ncbi:MAG: LytTR family DNA-binding domain-containing protein [Oceanicaulis sp.]
MKGPPVALERVSQLTRRLRLGAILRPAALILGVGTFLAILAPFESHTVGWPALWFYWVGLIGLGGVFGFGAGELAPRLLPGAPEWVIYAIIPAFVAVPVSVAILHLDGALSADLTIERLAFTYGPVYVVSAFVSAVAYAVDKLTARSQPASGAPARPARALTDKLPHRLRAAPVLALTSEDHYLRVRTANGEALILMRLTDAVAAMEGLDGARTHRSWWVAKDAVTDARKGDGRGVLVLSDGTEAPVSRTYYPALREAGWF